MPKHRVRFEASAAICLEIEVDEETEEAATRAARRLWNEKGLEEGLYRLIDVDTFAREGFAEALGLTIPYAAVSPDENGFEVVETYAADEKGA